MSLPNWYAQRFPDANSPQTDHLIENTGVAEETVDWFDGEGIPPLAMLDLSRVVLENKQEHTALADWARNGRNKSLLRLLVERRQGVTYDDITDRLDCSKSHARELVKELRDKGVVESSGRPATIRFTDERRELLAVYVTL